jgi:hypothetical protein
MALAQSGQSGPGRSRAGNSCVEMALGRTDAPRVTRRASARAPAVSLGPPKKRFERPVCWNSNSRAFLVANPFRQAGSRPSMDGTRARARRASLRRVSLSGSLRLGSGLPAPPVSTRRREFLLSASGTLPHPRRGLPALYRRSPDLSLPPGERAPLRPSRPTGHPSLRNSAENSPARRLSVAPGSYRLARCPQPMWQKMTGSDRKNRVF